MGARVWDSAMRVQEPSGGKIQPPKRGHPFFLHEPLVDLGLKVEASNLSW